MHREALLTLVVALACLAGGCRDAPAPDSSTASAPLSTTTVSSVTTTPAGPAAESPITDDARQECDRFTVALDRFVFNRLQPIVTEATDLLHSALESEEGRQVADRLAGAAARLEGLVDELDRLGIPPREVVDLLLSIRRGLQLYAEAFATGARGLTSDDSGLVERAAGAVDEASATLSSFFGWDLCG